MDPFLLEEWLRVASSFVSVASSAQARSTESAPEFTANSIVQSWAQIRACVQRKTLTPADSESFDLLNRHRRFLHLADSQAKLLLALLTEVSSSDVVLLGFVRRFAVLGLLGWIRKSFTGTATNASSIRQASETMASVVQNVRKAMEERPVSEAYTCEVILLLGTISTLKFVSPDLRSDCSNTVAVELWERKDVIGRRAIAEALAGAGCAMAMSQDHVIPIFRALLLLWTPLPPDTDTKVVKQQVLGVELEDRGTDGPNLKDVVMLLHLMDYLGSIFISRRTAQTGGGSQVELMHHALLNVIRDVDTSSTKVTVHCATIMASVGLLRSLYRWDQGIKRKGSSGAIDQKDLAIFANLEDVVVMISEQVVSPEVSISTFRARSRFPEDLYLQSETRHLCRCVSVAVSRCRGLPAHPCILHCLLICILGDALDLDAIYSALIAELESERSGVGQPNSSLQDEKPNSSLQDEKLLAGKVSLDQLEVHVGSFLFRETGAIARAMSDQYRRSSRDLQSQTEHLISDYARNLYNKHRLLVVATSQEPGSQGWPQHRQTLEKVLEAAFLTSVVFFSIAVREPMSDDSGNSEAELAALALDSLSCVEYFRHVQLSEFSKVIQRIVSRISGSEVASLALAHLLPAYEDVIQGPGSQDLIQSYNWDQDEVQTARILFYFRILPMCVFKMPQSAFATQVAPLMFLYMHHPSETLSKASHALFAAFLSLDVRPELMGKLDINNLQMTTIPGPETQPTITTLREQLVVFYMQRALQGFPGVTPFQGLVAGVGAIVHQLPSGSPATVYCLNCLKDKAAALFEMDFRSQNMERDAPQNKLLGESSDQQRQVPIEEMGAAQKLQVLLLHLILLVDLQVLPVLLKLVAKLLLGLPQNLRTLALTEAFDVLGGNDDYTRKLIIVTWLQSLAFLSFNVQGRSNSKDPPNEYSSLEINLPADVQSPSIDSAHNSANIGESKNGKVGPGLDYSESVRNESMEVEKQVISLDIEVDNRDASSTCEVQYSRDAHKGSGEDNRQVQQADEATAISSKL